MATIFETIESLGKVITDAVAAGDDSAVPARSIRKTLVKVSTGQYREVLPIIVPAECCVMGDELRSTNVQPRKATNSTLTPKADFKYSGLAIERIEEIISDVVEGIPVTATTGNSVAQVESWPYAEAPQVAPEVERLARSIRKTIDVKLGTKYDAELTPAYELDDPNFGYSRDLNQLNKEFIQAEIVAYLEEEYPNLKYSRTKCKQDVAFIIDSVSYDLTYGGNWQSVTAGEAYYEGATLNISTSEKQATLDAYTYLKALLQTVGRNITVTPAFQTEVEQIPGTGGTQTVSNEIAALMDDIIDIVNNGSGSVAITYPSLTDTPQDEQDASTALVAALPEIQEKTIDFINENFGDFTFDSAKYRTDFANILEDIAFDIALGTNYNGVANGLVYDKSYNREILQTDSAAIVGAIRFMRDEVADLISSSTATTRSNSSFNEIVEIIRNGRSAASSINYPEPTGVDQDRVDSKDLIQANIDFIVEDIIAYIDNQIQENTVSNPNPANIWFEFGYDEDRYRRELEYLLNSLSYDVLYQGTQAVTKLLESYFYQETTVWNGEIPNIVEAYEHLSDITKQVIQEQTVSAQTGNTEIQTTLGSPATATEAGQIETNIDIIQDALSAESLSSVPSISFPDTTWPAAEFQTAKNTVDTNADTIVVDAIQFVSNEYTGFAYNHAKCSRDLGLIAEAARYDWMLDTNYAGIISAYSYLRKPTQKVIGDQKDATIAANEYARRLIIENVNGVVDAIRTVNNTWQYVNDIIWSANSEGNVEQVDFIENYNATRQLELNKEFIVQEGKAYVDEWFVTAVSSASTTEVTIADTSWLTANMPIRFVDIEGSDVSTENAEIAPENNYFVKDIVDETTITVSTAPGGSEFEFTSVTADFTYDKKAFREETKLVVEGSSWDTVLDTNYNAVTRGLAIRRGTAGTDIATQLSETLDGIEKAKTLATDIRAVKLDVNALSRVTGMFDEVLDIVENGEAAADALSFPPGDLSTTDQQNAVDQLRANRDFLQAEFIAYIDQNYTSLSYDSDQRSDELGYFVDAICYDIMYGGNSASRQIAKIYTEDGNLTDGSTEQTAIVAGLDYIKTIIQEVIVETDVTELQAVVAQDFSNEPATATEATRAETLLDIPRNVANTLNLIVLGDVEYPIVTWIDQELQDAQFGLLNREEEISILTVRYLDKKYSFTFNLEADYDYDEELCARDLREYINAIKWDIVQPKEWERKYTEGVTIYRPGFYKSKLAGRYYANSVIGSQEEDFFYLRNGTGLRLMSLDGLKGDLGPANQYGTSRPTAGAYASLDPGFGPSDSRVWISARSPYVQNVSTFGFAAIGQKIDGALHDGGNDSIVSNDFTQVISDGIGAWITNNGRAELVSVFTYYAHIGYLSETGGRIRATNGNCSYGTFGASAEGVDPEETPVTATVDNRTQFNATVENVFTDQNQIFQLEFGHAGERYTEAQIDIFGAGDSEELVADEFRDGAVKQVRIVETDPESAGGNGFTLVSNTAQTGTTTSIFLAATDGNLSSAYPGMKVYVTAGAATGQYGTILTYNSGSKEATVVRPATLVPTNAGSFTPSTVYRIEEVGDTDWQSISSETLIDPRPGTVFTATAAGSGTGTAIEMEAGWEHVIPGTEIIAPNASSTYQVEPRAHFTAPAKTSTAESIPSGTYSTVEYFETSQQYNNLATTTNSDGTGATFDVTRIGSKYYVTINQAGEEYQRLDKVFIQGTQLDGASSENDIEITITTINESNGSIVDFDFEGYGRKGIFVVLPSSGNTAQTSVSGSSYSSASLASSKSWVDAASGLLDDGSTLFKPSFIVAVAEDGTANYSSDGETYASSDTGLGSGTIKIAFGQTAPGDNRFLVTNSNSTDVAASTDGGETWTTLTGVLPASGVTALTYGKGRYMALVGGSTDAFYSEDGGQTWTSVTLPTTADWVDVIWGNGRFVAIASDSITAVYSLDGITWTQFNMPTGGTYRRLSYGHGIFVATRDDNSVAYSEDGVLWETFALGAEAGGYSAIAHGNPNFNHQFLAIGGSSPTTTASVAVIGARAQGRPSVANEKIFEIRLTEPGSSYDAAPSISIFDPNNIEPVELSVRLGKGSLANPTFVARGSSFTTSTGEVNDTNSNGFADFFQDGSFIAVRRLSARPVSGSNIVFDSLPGQVFKLVNTVSFLGLNDGSFTGFLQVSPEMSITDAPQDGDGATLRIRYSQVRASSHDFLDVGTGNFVDTNYPGLPFNDPDQSRETNEFDGGRVFFTATDQDGNFRVGDLFSIEQATGVATLDAEAFNIAGLQELTLGEVTLGGNSAAVSEFSTDPFFTANSDTVVPTQRAVKAYIEAQIGGGGASLNVNSVTAGDVFINTNQITTVSGEQINIRANVNFEGAVLGQPLAYNYYLR